MVKNTISVCHLCQIMNFFFLKLMVNPAPEAIETCIFTDS